MATSSSRWTLLSIWLLLVCVAAPGLAVDCYNPDGSLAQNNYQPCNGHTGMCCGTNRGNDVNKCRPDGLCDQVDDGAIWRESCTDPTWKDPSCLQLCNSGTGKNPLRTLKDAALTSLPAVGPFGATVNGSTTDVQMTLCADGSYCCGRNNTNCCTAQTGYWIKGTKVFDYADYPFTSSGSSSSSTSASSGSGPTGSGNSSNPAPAAPASNSNTSKIAIGVGVGLGIPILLLLAGVIFLLTRRRREQQTNYYQSGEMQNFATDKHAKHAQHAHEVDNGGVVAELPGTAVPK